MLYPMTYYDVFNGDADGICALHQLRLQNPQESILITGVKRDIALLTQVKVKQGDDVTVLDISLDKNREALLNILHANATVNYFDHHVAGEIPRVANMHAHINTASDTCTSLLVNHVVKGEYLAWAVVGAFGDNLFDIAKQTAKPLDLSAQALRQLQELGTLINYNAYGVHLSDLHVHPAELYRAIQPYKYPKDFIVDSNIYPSLKAGYKQDMALAEHELFTDISDERGAAVVMLPDKPWARRISGVYANALARDFPNRAHALITKMDHGAYRVSVRAPLNNKLGADTLCGKFATGGGRKAAAGINDLPAHDLNGFIEAFKEQYK